MAGSLPRPQTASAGGLFPNRPAHGERHLSRKGGIAIQFPRLMADHGITCSMSRWGDCWDSTAMESCFSSLKTERTARKTCRTRNEAKADIFDYVERFYKPKRRHSTIGYLSPMEFKMRAVLA
jgi:putative transposase